MVSKILVGLAFTPYFCSLISFIIFSSFVLFIFTISICFPERIGYLAIANTFPSLLITLHLSGRLSFHLSLWFHSLHFFSINYFPEHIGDEGALAIANTFPNSLVTLYLSGRLLDFSLYQFTPLVIFLTPIFTDCNIGNKGAKALANTFPNSLTKLDLRGSLFSQFFRPITVLYILFSLLLYCFSF